MGAWDGPVGKDGCACSKAAVATTITAVNTSINSVFISKLGYLINVIFMVLETFPSTTKW